MYTKIIFNDSSVVIGVVGTTRETMLGEIKRAEYVDSKDTLVLDGQVVKYLHKLEFVVFSELASHQSERKF